MKKRKSQFIIWFVSALLLLVMILSVIPLHEWVFSMNVFADGEEPPEICELKIRYVTAIYSAEDEMTYVDIHATYHVQLPYGTDYEEPSPKIDNYALSNNDDAVVSGTVTKAYEEILVIYKESLGTAKYTVNYWTQEVDGTNLTKLEELCYEDEGEVGTSVTVQLPSVPGYSWSNDDLLIYITADGNAVKNVYYVKSENRKLVFRTGTGYAKVVEAAPGEEITEQRAAIRNVNPEKPGYEFVNWDTSIASLPEQIIYDSDGVTVLETYRCYIGAGESSDHKDHYYMPANDYVINAIWAKAATPYNVVFWFENTNGTGYVNGGLDTTRYALTDTEVTAAFYDKLMVDERTLFGATYVNDKFVRLENTSIQNITKDYANNDYNFVEYYSESAKDEHGNVLKDVHGNDVVITYTNTYENPQGKTYAQYKTTPFFGFDFDHCNNVVVTADGNATLNVYYRRETWIVKIYKKPSTVSISNGNGTWRTIEGNYGSIVPAVQDGEADDFSKLPLIDTAETYYNNNKPSGTSVNFQDLRTKSTSDGTLFNLEAQQIFSSEDGNGLHVYSVYPFYNAGDSAKSKRMFYGANLNVTPNNSQNLTDYVNFATSSSSAFSGTIQPAFVFDEARLRKYTWEGAKFRYRSCTAGTKEANITEAWSAWKNVDTTTKPDPADTTQYTDKIGVGNATVFLRNDGVAYWYFHNESVKKDFYLEVILPRKSDLKLNFISHNTTLKTEEIECEEPLASYYTYTPADTATEHFVGWYEDAEMTQPVDPAAVMGYVDNNIYAKWESKQYNLSLDPRNGTDVIVLPYQLGKTLQEVLTEHAVSLTKVGFRFVGWYTDGNSRFREDEELNSDLALHAVWEPLEMADYIVKHILKHSDSTEELILETTGHDSIHKTVTVSALTNNQTPSYIFKNLYVVHDGSSSATQSIYMDKPTLAERTAIFYYNEMTEWGYTISYLDINDTTTKIKSDLDAETDLLTITVQAPQIAKDGEIWVPVTGIGHRLVPALASARLVPGGTNPIKIYYDVQHTMNFDLDGGMIGALFNNRYLVKEERTTVPSAPTYDGHIFLCWEYTDGDTVTVYKPGDTFTMPNKDATLKARWAEASAKANAGRLLDRQTVGSTDENIAQNGTVTAIFALVGQNGAKITPNDLSLWSHENFPKDTIITLIVYNDASGQSGASYYYYKVNSAMQAIPLTDFIGMGQPWVHFGRSGKVDSFYCHACVKYPGATGNDVICLSAYAVSEQATSVNLTFDREISAPSGNVAATANTAPQGELSTTVTVSNLVLTADQSDSRHTHGTLQDYKAILTIGLKDEDNHQIPFPENSTVIIGGTTVKEAGTNNVAGIVTSVVVAGAYTVTATGLPTDRQLTVYFTLGVADSEVSIDFGHPLRIELATTTATLAYQKVPEYAIRAELSGTNNEIADYSIFKASELTADKTLTFSVRYLPEDSEEAISVTSYFKDNGNYAVTATNWNADISDRSQGRATVVVTIPAGTEAGTYRLKFAIGNATHYFNLIVLAD